MIGAQAAGLLAGRDRPGTDTDDVPPGQAEHDRQVAGDRQPRRTATTRSRSSASTGGGATSVTDDEIIEGMKLLAETEGIFAETAGGVTVAVLKKLAERGQASAPTSWSWSTSPATA